jgi:hypothetical protein
MFGEVVLKAIESSGRPSFVRKADESETLEASFHQVFGGHSANELVVSANQRKTATGITIG